MDKIVNAGIRITRKCNMNCPYCNIVSRETEDLSLEKWMETFGHVYKTLILFDK